MERYSNPPGPVPKIRRFKDIAARFSFHFVHTGGTKIKRYSIMDTCIMDKSIMDKSIVDTMYPIHAS